MLKSDERKCQIQTMGGLHAEFAEGAAFLAVSWVC